MVSDKAQWLELAEFQAKIAAVVVHWAQTNVEALHCRVIADVTASVATVVPTVVPTAVVAVAAVAAVALRRTEVDFEFCCV